MKSVIWVCVNSNNKKEAGLIGKTLLKERLAACYGLYPKIKSVYFWPAGTNRLEQSKGPLLVLETLPKYYRRVQSRVKQLHSDKVPFIGFLEMKGVSGEFFGWMKGELTK